MTINSEVRTAGPFEGNDVATSFPFEFKVFADSEVLVVRELDGVELVLDLGTDYTVALNADQDSAPGGSVDLPVPLPVGYTLSMTSALAPLQPVDLTNQGGFYPRVINASLDRLTILVQQLSERLSRGLTAPISDGGAGFGDLPGVSVRKGVVLAFNELTGAPQVGPSIASVGAVAANTSAINTVAGSIDDINTVAANVADVTNFADVYYGPNTANPSTRRDGSPLQKGDLYFNTSEDAMRIYDGTRWGAVASGSIGSTDFSGDGVTVDFVLASSPGAKNNTQVYINGVYQQKSEYALTGVGGTTITFNSPPPAGTNNIEVITFAPLPVDPLTAEDIADLIELRGTAVRKDSDTGAAKMPAGATAQRPGAPSAGMSRYNSEIGQNETFQNGVWVPQTTKVVNALTTSRNLALTDTNSLNINTSASNLTVTIPAQASVAWLGNVEMDFLRAGTGTITITAATGVTLNGQDAGSVVIESRYGLASLKRTAANQWVIGGPVKPEALFGAEYLLIGGGGAGGTHVNNNYASSAGGGGGGKRGGVVTLARGVTYQVVVGSGGTPSAVLGPGGDGGNTTFSGDTAIGGGGGGFYTTPGRTGGCGGGGGGATASGGAGTAGQGFAGGNATVNSSGGGGGGTAGAGANGVTGAAGNGGAGASSSISGSAVNYGGGGGGGRSVNSPFTAGTGGTGGGGAGGVATGSDGLAGTDGLGGGGGGQGGGVGTVSNKGGRGGSGTAVIRYLGAPRATGGTITEVGGYTIHTFTSSGNLVIT